MCSFAWTEGFVLRSVPCAVLTLFVPGVVACYSCSPTFFLSSVRCLLLLGRSLSASLISSSCLRRA